MYTLAMSKRVPVQIRMNPSGIEIMDKIAGENDVSRSDVMRACFAIGLANQKELVRILSAIKEEL